MFKSHFGRSGFSDPCPPDGPAPVPKTGQTTAYAAGDDGDLEKGVSWPNPRFTDNGDGTVTDNLTGLIWLKNANCFGYRTWFQALSDGNGLANGSCGLTDGSTAGNWRLPNRNELNSLINCNRMLPALSDTQGTGWWSEGDPFSNVDWSGTYWTSTNYTDNPDNAWKIEMNYGHVGEKLKISSAVVWPVRGGH
jgi:hypothetical protein